MRLLLIKSSILLCFLTAIVSCAGRGTSQIVYYRSENLTMTCVYKTLEQMEAFSKVWIFTGQKSLYPVESYGSLKTTDGVAFEGDGYIGHVSFERFTPGYAGAQSHVSGNVLVYTNESSKVDSREASIRKELEKVIVGIEESLSSRCGYFYLN